MVYLIIGILLLLLYVFATPESIKGTVNIVLVVFAFVALLILLMLSVLQIFQLPTEFFIAIAMLFLAYFSLRDIYAHVCKKEQKKINRKRAMALFFYARMKARAFSFSIISIKMVK